MSLPDPLHALDLNLLLHLDALLAEQSVTRAARRLGRSQPAVSQALERLRQTLDDPLLVRAGRGMVRSPRAEALALRLPVALDGLRAALAAPAPFDAATSRRTFSLVCPDLLGPALPALLGALGAEAPGVVLRVLPPRPDALAGADLALGPRGGEAPGHQLRALGVLRWAVVARRGHPAGKALDAESWARWPHVVVRTGDEAPNRLGEAIAAAGVRRQVGLEVPGFLAALLAVAGTDLLHTAPDALVQPLVDRLGLHLYPPPVPLPPLPVAAFWHERHQADPGHRWFRERVVEALGRLLV